MYKQVLVATDGSKLSNKAVLHAIGLAKSVGAKLTAFWAAPDYPQPMYAEGIAIEHISKKEYEAATRKHAERILSPVVAKAKAAGVDCKPLHAIAASPWVAILEAAKKTKADSIVMASHGRRGIEALLIGSETTRVLTHSKVPVVVVR